MIVALLVFHNERQEREMRHGVCPIAGGKGWTGC
jgi:hypothetical protein